LQDMAVPLLAKEASDVYVRLIDARDNGRIRLSYLEQRLFGWNHAEAAGIMARQWNLPDAFAVLVEHHHAVDRWASETEVNPAKFAVALSALLPTVLDPLWNECQLFEHYYAKVLPPGSPPVSELLAQVDREYADFAPLLKLSIPSKSLVDSFAEVTVAAP
jgi:hypothetical protein